MPSFAKIATLAAGFAVALVSAAPGLPRLTARQTKLYELGKRQNAAATALGISDVDIAQFALTLEWLENEFYSQGFAKFGDEAFRALGLSEQQVKDLKSIGKTEETHVITLQSAIAAAGVQPVQPCTYNFGFTDAAGMVATAAVLESVGVSAYLGAATLVFDPKILALAGSILTVEARHQTFIRAASGIVASPSAFDTPLSPKAIFSLAAPFIQSCPEGSNLILTAFPKMALSTPQAADLKTAAAGSMLNFQSDAAATATHCGFTAAGAPGGTAFTTFSAATGCALPPNISGLVYVSLTNAAPKNGVVTDAITVAGPAVVQLS